MRGAALMLAMLAASGLAMAQSEEAQLEAVPPAPGFDMWDLDALEDPAIQLPDEILPPATSELPGDEATGFDTDDPCRHFSAEQRKSFPTLCGSGH